MFLYLNIVFNFVPFYNTFLLIALWLIRWRGIIMTNSEITSDHSFCFESKRTRVSLSVCCLGQSKSRLMRNYLCSFINESTLIFPWRKHSFENRLTFISNTNIVLSLQICIIHFCNTFIYYIYLTKRYSLKWDI